MRELVLDGATLSPAAVHAVAHGAPVRLGTDARRAMETSSSWYAEHGADDVLRSKWAWLVGGRVPTDAPGAVRAFLEGHCAGVGAPLSREEVRALLVVRANALAAGWSGVRPVVVERLLAFLERGWTPVVPSLGSVGAAGCIALAHTARVVLGLGGTFLADGDPQPRDAAVALEALGPLLLTEKEALSLINGSSLATAQASLAVVRARRVLEAGEVACALSMEVVRADLQALDPRSAAASRHPGIASAAGRLRSLVAGSELVTDKRAPDSFSVRCAPVVLGAVRDALDHVRMVVTRELNGASDNPLVVAGEVTLEGGYFHGAPVAMVMDHLKVAMAQLAGISERRIFRLTYGELSGLPSFLVPGSGVNSGLMLAQYTAASLTSEARQLAMPGSVDTVPTVQHQEDHVPMGPSAARGALEVIERVADVVAIELLCGAQGLDFRMSGEMVDADGQVREGTPVQPGQATREAHRLVRERVPRLTDDRPLHPDLVVMGAAVRDGVFRAGVEPRR
ncbi:MAG: aromatic amino acid lyase [Myxococcales bacterium]|nr:aromatic amino acid lyase [Myxococcales bacterium]